MVIFQYPFYHSATHPLETRSIKFKDLVTFKRCDFLLSDTEAHGYLNLPILGLPERLKTPAIIQLLIHECNGLVGALRMAVDILSEHIPRESTPSESDLMAYYPSRTCLRRMSRCFSLPPAIPSRLRLREFLIQCFIARSGPPLPPIMSEEDKQYCMNLKNIGILVENVNGRVRFSSPLAERYFSKWLFPERAIHDPTSLPELITAVFSNMSTLALQASVIGDSKLPTEAVLQHEFIKGLALNTRANCSICHDISRLFPPVHKERGFDIYLSGEVRWGLVLLVNGDDVEIDKHMERFTPKGQYAALQVRDYTVINIQGVRVRISHKCLA